MPTGRSWALWERHETLTATEERSLQPGPRWIRACGLAPGLRNQLPAWAPRFDNGSILGRDQTRNDAALSHLTLELDRLSLRWRERVGATASINVSGVVVEGTDLGLRPKSERALLDVVLLARACPPAPHRQVADPLG